jgi:hypothetical protein
MTRRLTRLLKLVITPYYFNYRETQFLVPQYFVYYTWMNPLKPRELIVSCNSKSATIELTVSQPVHTYIQVLRNDFQEFINIVIIFFLQPHRGVLDTSGNDGTVNYIVFIDGVQTVLLFSTEIQIIEAALNVRMTRN